MPLISVIVPVYKVEKYLDRCVESILAQTFTDFELILVDDGSPDNCPRMCDDWAQKDSRICVIHKNNEGVSKARNDAVLEALGEFITFVDSDDTLKEEYLSILYQYALKFNADISVGMIKRDDRNIGDSNKITLFDNREAVNHFCKCNDERFRAPMAKLIKKQILLDNSFPTDRSYAEDMAVVYKWYYASTRVVEIECQIYNYRINTEGATFRPYGLHRLGNLKTLSEMLLFFKINGFDDLYEFKLSEYMYQLYWQHNELVKMNETKIASAVMSELKKRLSEESLITMKDYPQYFNYAYPFRMKIYWTLQGIKTKIKKFFGVK